MAKDIRLSQNIPCVPMKPGISTYLSDPIESRKMVRQIDSEAAIAREPTICFSLRVWSRLLSEQGVAGVL